LITGTGTGTGTGTELYRILLCGRKFEIFSMKKVVLKNKQEEEFQDFLMSLLI
jgi:hypothetical protein